MKRALIGLSLLLPAASLLAMEAPGPGECATCHPASGGVAGIEDSHLTLNLTPNNPNLPAGAPEALGPTVTAAALTLLDHETSVAMALPAEDDEAARYLAFHTGVRIGDSLRAAHLLERGE